MGDVLQHGILQEYLLVWSILKLKWNYNIKDIVGLNDIINCVQKRSHWSLGASLLYQWENLYFIRNEGIEGNLLPSYMT